MRNEGLGRSVRWAAASLMLAALLAPKTAHAWCRTTTTQSSFVPSPGKPCNDTGKPLQWSSKCVGFSIQQNASAKVTLAAARALADVCFAEWFKHPCPADPYACSGATTGLPSVTASQLDPVACDQVQYNETSGNANTVIFHDDAWPHDPKQIALTTITFVAASGEIYDADMEVNTAEYKIVASDVPKSDEYDLRSILTHEAGHFYGLAHAPDIEATMYPSYDGGETKKRDLAQDDICGICAAYPPVRTATCDTTPHNGFASTCGTPPAPKSSSGCHCNVVSSGGEGDGSLAGLTFALLAVVTRLTRVAARTRSGRLR